MAFPDLTDKWAENAPDNTDPGQSKTLQGWVAEVPEYQNQNWWQNRVDNALEDLRNNKTEVHETETDVIADQTLTAGILVRTMGATSATDGDGKYWLIVTSGASGTFLNLDNTLQAQKLNVDSDTLNDQLASFYTNASNLNSGTVPLARLTSASTVAQGIIEIADLTEVDTGTNNSTAVSPLGLQDKLDNTGVQVATTPQTVAGVSTTLASAPEGVVAAIDDRVPPASTSAVGKVELANNTETQTGTDSGRAVTPAGLTSRTATTSRTGIIELATNAETEAGTDTTRAVTPATLNSFSQDNAGNDGYQKLPGGLIIAWGSVLVGNVVGGGTGSRNSVTFAISIPNLKVVNATYIDATTASSCSIRVVSQSSSGAEFSLQEVFGATQNATIKYTAIGY